MDRRSVFTKTAKGLMEATGKTSLLARDLRNLLKEVDGKVTVGDLKQKFPKETEAKLLQALVGMAKEGFIREFVAAAPKAAAPSPQPSAPSPAADPGGDDDDLDFTSLAGPASGRPDDQAQKRAAEAAAKLEADNKARTEALARARAEAAVAG